MGFDYGYDYGYGYTPGISGNMSGFLGTLLGFFLVFYLLLLAFAVLSYVLQSAGMYTIAKRRGIRNPWLSWLPVGNMWILGSISDQYQYLVKGRIRNRRKTLMGLTIAMMVIGFVSSVSAFASVFSEAAGLDSGEILFGATLGITLITYFVIAVISLVALVIQYMALYDLYVSCQPDNGVLYLVLSIFVGAVMPFLIFFSRKKDFGMPPRKETEPEIPEVVAEIVEEESEEFTEE